MKETLDDYTRLTLKRAREEDVGTYCILAKNRYGCDRAFFTVYLRERPTSPEIPSADIILQNIANYHERRYFTDVPGPISGDPIMTNSGRNWLSLSWHKPQHRGAAPVMAYRVDVWLPGGEGARWKQLGITGSTNFDVFNLNPNGEYQFRITPKNRYGWGEAKQTELFVLGDCTGYPEFVQNLPGQVKGLLKSELSLQCKVRDEPDLHIKWCHNGREVKEYEDNRYKILKENNMCTLIISSVQESDGGSFMCEAINKIGRASTFTRLYVIDDPKILKADVDLKFLQVNVATAEAPPQFLMRLRDRRVEVSYPVRLTCQVIGYPTPEIAWLRDGHKICEDHRHKFLNDNQFYTLEIDKTILDDSASYSVSVKNIFGSVSCHCKLIVDKGLKAYIVPEFSSKFEPEIISVIEGKELKLSVRVRAYPAVTVLWYRNGVRLRPNRNTIMSLTHDGRINFSLAKTKAEDAGFYTCIATNELGRCESCVKVDVTKETAVTNGECLSDIKTDIPYSKEPKFLKKPRSFDGCEGDNIIICCEVIGDPKPEVIWLRDFLRPDYYKDSPHFLRIGNGPEYRLEIPEAKLDFTGTYTVIAKNCYGEAKAIISLQIKTIVTDQGSQCKKQKIFGKVQTIPKVIRELCDIRCCDGDAVTLECEVEKSLTQDIRWEKSNKLVRLGGDFISEFDGSIARLLIKKVYPEDEGEYTCVVYNDLGDARTSACLLVDVPEEKDNLLTEALSRPADISQKSSRSSNSLSPINYSSHTFSKISKHREVEPKFYAIPHNRIAEEGETVRFRCSITGYPEPRTLWTKDGCPITSSSRVIITEQGDLRILEISNVVLQDSGLYCVTIENSVGKVKASARLEVTSYKKYLTSALRARSASPSSSYRKYNGGDGSYGSNARIGHQSYSSLYNQYHRICNTMNSEQNTMHARKTDKCKWGIAPYFIKELPDVIRVREGQSTQLTAHVSGDRPFCITWFKDERYLPSCSDFEQLLLANECAVLNISDVFMEDFGVYKCNLTNKYGTISSECYLKINDCENTPHIEFVETPSPLVVSFGRTASFSAQIRSNNHGEAIFVWKVCDRCVTTSDKYKVEVEEDRSTLHILDVTHLDSGQVSCSAYLASEENSRHSPVSSKENLFSSIDNNNALCIVNYITELKVVPASERFGSASIKSDCTSSAKSVNTMFFEPESVDTAAVLLKGPKDTNALVGDRVLLKATYTGQPEPLITWTKAGKKLTNSKRIWITSGDGITCLLLENITTHDSGKYGVHIENIYGNHQLYASLSVEGPPDPPQGKPSVVAAFESAIVTWSSSPYDGGRIITGFALEYSLVDSNDWIVAIDNCHTLNYNVNGLKSNSFYIFRVRAINVHGSSPPSLESDKILINSNAAAAVPLIVTLEPHALFQMKYEVLEEIGKGRYGVVYNILNKNTCSTFAAKFVRCRTAKDRKKIQDEIDIMNMLRHPKLVQLLAAYENSREMILVTEYISGGELFERVVADDFTLTERDCILFMRQICEAVAYMHQQSIVHLDLKPENIMCYTRTSHEIKLIDFGLAQKLDPKILVRVLFGTAEFVSPEIINYEPIGTKSDMWSIGIISYVLLSGLSPFMGDNDAETFANITRADYDFNDEAFDTISQSARDFIGALLLKQKDNRLSAEECLKHKWLDPEQHQNTVVICKEKLKKFIIRRKWQKTGNAIRAVGRMTNLYASRRSSASNVISNGTKSPSNTVSKSLSFDVEETVYHCSDHDLKITGVDIANEDTIDSGVISETSIDNFDESFEKALINDPNTEASKENVKVTAVPVEPSIKTSVLSINLEINAKKGKQIVEERKENSLSRQINDIWKYRHNGHCNTNNVHDKRSHFEITKTNDVKKGKQ
ncbi:hypothetical protein FQA39_LY05765 [Lamprigera yunnana]|nr:hypothetical protein FQA39_LY05765 [Lamprigera yunnana]